MGALSHQPNLAYSIQVLDSPVVNAFAVPGGYVYLTRGILAYLNDEAEFADVMAHEIGHIAARHSAQHYSRAQVAQLGLGLGAMVSKTFRKYTSTAEFGVGMLFLSFSNAVILFSMAPEKTPSAAADAFLKESKAVVAKSENAKVNGMQAHRIISDITTEQGLICVPSYLPQERCRRTRSS